MNHNYCRFLFLSFLFFALNSVSQTSEKERIILRDNHIKRILTYYNDTSEDSKYLSSICFLNDSGLVAKELWLRRNGDTINSYSSQYDSHNRIILYQAYGKNPFITIYDYPKKGATRIIQNSRDTTINNYHRYIEFKGKKRILCFFFLNGQFKKLYRITKKDSYIRYHTRKFNKLKTSVVKTVEYLDNDKNIIRACTIYKSKIKVVTGGYTQTETATGITEDHSIKKKIAQISEFECSYEYNAMKLLSKRTSYPVKQTGDVSTANSSCSYTFFEYETE